MPPLTQPWWCIAVAEAQALLHVRLHVRLQKHATLLARLQQPLALYHVPAHRERQEHHGAAATPHVGLLLLGATPAVALAPALAHAVKRP